MPPADLVPREVGERWLKYFREELPTVAFKCSTQQQGSGLKQGKMPSAKSLQEGLAVGGCWARAVALWGCGACLSCGAMLQLLAG